MINKLINMPPKKNKVKFNVDSCLLVFGLFCKHKSQKKIATNIIIDAQMDNITNYMCNICTGRVIKIRKNSYSHWQGPSACLHNINLVISEFTQR